MARIVTFDERRRLAAEVDLAIDKWSRTPFEWGKSDCLLSLADIIATATGFDPAAEYRGRYHTMIGAARVTRRWNGFAGALERAAKLAGWKPIKPSEAQIGDIGIVENARGPRCGVVRHHLLWVGRTEGAGFCGVPSDRVLIAWSVA